MLGFFYLDAYSDLLVMLPRFLTELCLYMLVYPPIYSFWWTAFFYKPITNFQIYISFLGLRLKTEVRSCLASKEIILGVATKISGFPGHRPLISPQNTISPNPWDHKTTKFYIQGVVTYQSPAEVEK